MNTNNDNIPLPDEAFLEKLANQLFNQDTEGPISAGENLPGAGVVQQQSGPLSHYDYYLSQGNGVGLATPAMTTVPVYPGSLSAVVPPSATGLGISPMGSPYSNPFDVKEQGMSLFPTDTGGGIVPPSVAGSGVSPSVSSYSNFVDIKNPGLHTPNYSNIGGGIPPSVAGSGASPSVSHYSHPVDAREPSVSSHNNAEDGIVPASVGGSGASPAVPGTSKAINVKDHDLPTQYYSENGGRIPASLAGSGASPSSVIEHGNNINIKDPQTGFPDKNIEREKGSSGSDEKSSAYYPFEGDPSFLADLQNALSSIHFLTPTSQFPEVAHAPGWGGAENIASYYFLGGKPDPGEPSIPLFPDNQEAPYEGIRLSKDAAQPWGFDANLIKKDFPILNEPVNGRPLIWLDNAATTQKPKLVIERISYFYEHENSNVHRAAHELAARATDAYETARKKVQTFINAGSVNEIVFVRGTTEAINLVAKSWGEQYLQAGDEIIISHLEHHANIVPWQQLVSKKGVKLRVIPVDDDGQILLDEYAKLLNAKTKLVSFTYVSNALGTITPVKEIIEMAHQAGAKVLLDGAQSVSHIRSDVRLLDADWFVFSGHKMFGPTGIGVLYGKEDLLNQTGPWQGGGNMIKDVTFEYTQYQQAPYRFEAGTGNIADAVGLGAAIDYINRLGIDNIYQYEHYLLLYATQLLKMVPGLTLIGTAKEKTSVLSFILDGYTNEEVGQALNKEGVAVRAGHHCAQPILRRFGLESTVRPSLAFYNTCSDVDILAATLWNLRRAKK